ncbi:hypothetical protein wVul_1350 [Wolbachia endosymbiont of Armadillidium vulgare str. wVulC]|nr:hypothetical protein wVul_1350 [Wolbachia endosymbiont of Armadillidium vulgare str. wVulC]
MTYRKSISLHPASDVKTYTVERIRLRKPKLDEKKRSSLIRESLQ